MSVVRYFVVYLISYAILAQAFLTGQNGSEDPGYIGKALGLSFPAAALVLWLWDRRMYLPLPTGRPGARAYSVWAEQAGSRVDSRLGEDETTVVVAREPADIGHLGFPWQAARWLFASRTDDDAVLGVVRWVRSIAGVAFIVLISRRLQVEPTPELFSPWLIVINLIGIWLIMLLIWRTTAAGHRAETLRSFRYPARTTGIFLAVVTGLAGYAALLNWAIRSTHVVGALVVAVFGWAVMVWVALFGVCTLFILYRDPFRAADGHPLLDPLISIWTALCTAALALVGPRVLPPLWGLFVAGGALLSTVAISLWEIWRFRDRYALVLREGIAGAGFLERPAGRTEPRAGDATNRVLRPRLRKARALTLDRTAALLALTMFVVGALYLVVFVVSALLLILPDFGIEPYLDLMDLIGYSSMVWPWFLSYLYLRRFTNSRHRLNLPPLSQVIPWFLRSVRRLYY